jgi:nucleotide-binding universal stress UspA family protein
VTEVAGRPWPRGTAVEVLTVIHSAVPLAIDPALVLAAIHVDQTDEQRHLASALVGAAAKQIGSRARHLRVTTRILEGTPKDVIVEEAAAWGATLIILGSHGHGRLRRVMLGSVAGAVVANAPCSVEVVRATHLLRETESAA